MIRATVTPENQDISIHVPASYIGRAVEVLRYPADEITEQQEQLIKKSVAGLRGSLKLTNEQFNDLQEYLKEVRNEWE